MTQTRRQLILGGLGLTAAAAGAPAAAEAANVARAASEATGLTVANPSGASDHDRLILERLLLTERLLQYAYEQAIGTGKLGADSQRVVALILDQEFAHTRALSARLAAIPKPRSTPKHATKRHPFPPPKVAALFKPVKTESGALAAVVEIENLAESSYYMAVAALHDPALITMATQILANEAQHWTLLASLLHKGRPEAAVPHPYVRGSQQLRPLKVP